MILAAELAGFFAAHAVWSVSDGAALIPMLAYTTGDGKRNMERLVGEMKAMVELGRKKLDDNPMDANDAVLLYDGYLTLDGKKIDTIFVEARAYFMPGARMMLGIPYTPPASGKFRVYKPKLLEWQDCDDIDQQAALKVFFDGVDAHEQGAAVWNAALDQSK
jgi:hypothetical protein